MNQVLLDLGRLFSPVGLFQRQVAVADEPSKRDRSIHHGLVAGCLAAQFGDFHLQLSSGFELGHLCPQPEDDRKGDHLRA